MSDKNEVKEHVQKMDIETVMVVPSHKKRAYDKTFEEAKREMRKDGNLNRCWLCGGQKDLQVHHFWAEHCESQIIDYVLLEQLCDMFDIYGYSKKYGDKPITEISDIRQLMTLCEEHHIGTDSTNGGTPTGIHQLPFSEWILQKVAVISPIPQEGQTIEFVEKEIEKFQEKEESNEKS